MEKKAGQSVQFAISNFDGGGTDPFYLASE